MEPTKPAILALAAIVLLLGPVNSGQSGALSPRRGNFCVLVRGNTGAAPHFSHLWVGISGIELEKGGGGRVALPLAQGEEEQLIELVASSRYAAAELWAGRIATGTYDGACLHVARAWGVREDTGEIVPLAVGDGELRLPGAFRVAAGRATELVFGIEVLAEGTPPDGAGCRLAPARAPGDRRRSGRSAALELPFGERCGLTCG